MNEKTEVYKLLRMKGSQNIDKIIVSYYFNKHSVMESWNEPYHVIKLLLINKHDCLQSKHLKRSCQGWINDSIIANLISFFASIFHSWIEYCNAQTATRFKTRMLISFMRQTHENLKMFPNLHKMGQRHFFHFFFCQLYFCAFSVYQNVSPLF